MNYLLTLMVVKNHIGQIWKMCGARAGARCGSAILQKPIRTAPESPPSRGRRNILGMEGDRPGSWTANIPPIPKPSVGEGSGMNLEPATGRRDAALRMAVEKISPCSQPRRSHVPGTLIFFRGPRFCRAADQKLRSTPRRMVRGRSGVICPPPATEKGVPSAKRLPIASVRLVTPRVTPKSGRPIRAVSEVSK